jgi:hypothetical protein
LKSGSRLLRLSRTTRLTFPSTCHTPAAIYTRLYRISLHGTRHNVPGFPIDRPVSLRSGATVLCNKNSVGFLHLPSFFKKNATENSFLTWDHPPFLHLLGEAMHSKPNAHAIAMPFKADENAIHNLRNPNECTRVGLFGVNAL